MYVLMMVVAMGRESVKCCLPVKNLLRQVFPGLGDGNWKSQSHCALADPHLQGTGKLRSAMSNVNQVASHFQWCISGTSGTLMLWVNGYCVVQSITILRENTGIA